ncbi:hypothetical protein D3C76_1608460 [compost metagenome]
MPLVHAVELNIKRTAGVVENGRRLSALQRFVVAHKSSVLGKKIVSDSVDRTLSAPGENPLTSSCRALPTPSSQSRFED